MNNLKVVKVTSNEIEFENGVKLHSEHRRDCCENHYLSFNDLTLNDFEGLTFNLSDDSFFKRVPDYGIELIPTNGHPVRIPGYGYNNGYYSSNLDLVIKGSDFEKTFDVSDCQVIEG